jgi:transcriptional regulator with XRE-family HTH domain
MARAALNWTLREMEVKSGINKNTISRYEAGEPIMSNTLQRLEELLRSEGLMFIEEDEHFGPGVRVRRSTQSEARNLSKTINEKTKPKPRVNRGT